MWLPRFVVRSVVSSPVLASYADGCCHDIVMASARFTGVSLVLSMAQLKVKLTIAAQIFNIKAVIVARLVICATIHWKQ